MLAGLGEMGVGATGGAGGHGMTATTANPATTGGNLVNAYGDTGMQQLGLTQTYAPQYAGLESSILNQQMGSLTGNYFSTAPSLQNSQALVNQQQAGANIGLLGQYGSSAIQTYQAANPQLQQLQNQFVGMAMQPQNPVQQMTGFGQWGSGFTQGVGQTVAGNQINAGQNQTVQQLNNVAQQQLALGGSVSPQQAATLSNQVLSNYNQMGRANDPTAIAGLATGLDTYSQQLLQQREANAASAGTLQAQQQGLGVSAQAGNLQGALQGQQLNYQGLYGAGAQQLQGGQSNQLAQLSNAQYQQSLMGNASQLAQSTAQTPYSMLLSQGTGLNNAMGLTALTSAMNQNNTSLANMYNPYQSQLANTLTNASEQSTLANAKTNQSLFSSGQSMFGSGYGSSGLGK